MELTASTMASISCKCKVRRVWLRLALKLWISTLLNSPCEHSFDPPGSMTHENLWLTAPKGATWSTRLADGSKILILVCTFRRLSYFLSIFLKKINSYIIFNSWLGISTRTSTGWYLFIVLYFVSFTSIISRHFLCLLFW